MALLFLNGGGMSGGELHHQLQGTPLLRTARSAPRYRFYAVDGRFPAMQEVASGGVSVAGEVYDVALRILHDHLLPAEPAQLELGVIELDDGDCALATVLRAEYRNTSTVEDISDYADWRAYRAAG